MFPQFSLLSWSLDLIVSVVFYDALVGAGVLDFAAPGARQVYVGKRFGRHSKDQIAIDLLIVEAALAGERVVRLKGGDPAIFGRATEELDACRAASLGLSLTLRGVARKLIFVTAHVRAGEELDLDWQALADPEATLAVYMGKAAANEVSNRLIAAGLAADPPVALVENASLPEERVFNTRLDLLGLASLTALGGGPALLLIGEALRVATDGDSTSTVIEAKTSHTSLPPAFPLERRRNLPALAMAPYPKDRGTARW